MTSIIKTRVTTYDSSVDHITVLRNLAKTRTGENVQRTTDNHVELLHTSWGLLRANRQRDTRQIGLCERHWQAEGGMSESKK